MRIPGVELDHAFADALHDSVVFREWILSGGRFARYAAAATLLWDEQGNARRAKFWWKHWWCRMPDGSEGETDIFVVFEIDKARRFALHIENKPPHGKLAFEQANAYRRRAAYKSNDPLWLNYEVFEVLIVASQTFLSDNDECVRQFDRAISYENIARYVPLFGQALED